MKSLIIQGSSRSEGNTHEVINYLKSTSEGQIDSINLQDYQISYFDYEHKNRDDDFLPLMKKIIAEYDTFIFATPIYWYSMSAIMKTFFDRLSDLLKIEKDLGRQLRGKSMAMISCSGHDDRSIHFSEPFKLTADYLGMHYLGDVHSWVDELTGIPEEARQRLDEFSTKVMTKG